MHRLTAVGIALLAFAPDVHALLCANNNGRLAVRDVCKSREHEIPIATLLPPPRATLVTDVIGATALMPHGTKVARLILPSPIREPSGSEHTGSYALFATVHVVNNGAVADNVDCSIVIQTPGTGIPNGLQLTGAGTTLDASARTILTLVGTLPDVNLANLQNGSGALALWCFAAPESGISAEAANMLAIPVDQVDFQQPSP